MEPDPFEPPDPPPPLPAATPPAGPLVNVLSVLVAPFVVAWDALRYLDRVVLPALGRALQRTLTFLAGITRGIVRPFRTALRMILDLVLRVVQLIGRV